MSASKAHELGGRDVSERMLEALTHASFAHEQQTATAHNERLEFLGDAVVNLVVAEELFRRHPDASEGRLSQMKAGIVSEKALADAFRRSGLKELLRLGRGEARSGGRERPSIQADAFEAVSAALYLDGGLEEARRWILERLEPAFAARGTAVDPKSQLQELLQGSSKSRPTYRLCGSGGPDHAKWFACEVYVGDRLLGRGEGRSKKAAEQAAAAEALRRLKPIV